MFALESADWECFPYNNSGKVHITFASNNKKEAYALWQYFCQFYGQIFDPYSMRRQQDDQPTKLGQQAAIGHTPQLTDGKGQNADN